MNSKHHIDLFRTLIHQIKNDEAYKQFEDSVIGKFRENDYRRLPYEQFEDPRFPGLRSLSDLNSKRVKSNVLYKYVSKDALVHILAPNGGIRFCEPTQWNDKYESIFYRSEKYLSDDLKPKMVYASCFTTKRENEAAWKAYLSSDGKELNQILSFRLEINRTKMIDELIKQFRGYGLYEAPVAYLHKKQVRSSLDPMKPHIKGFPQGTFEKGGVSEEKDYISLLSVKRDYFSYEEETRYFIVAGNGATSVQADYKYLLNPLSFINKITVVRPYGKLCLEPCDKLSFELTREELDSLAAELGVKPSLMESYNPYKF